MGIVLFWMLVDSGYATGIRTACIDQQYNSATVPEKISVDEKKLRFRCLVQADIEAVYTKLLSQYLTVRETINKDPHDEVIQQLKIKYSVETNQQLLSVIKPHPKSIAIAQAAIESAWGTSRFFREANNVYGIRAFSETQPRIAAGVKTGNSTLWLKKYNSIKESIVDYYHTLSRGTAFKGFRQLNMQTSDPHKLIKQLKDYSERKDAYVRELSSMIRYNEFYKLDQ